MSESNVAAQTINADKLLKIIGCKEYELNELRTEIYALATKNQELVKENEALKKKPTSA